MPFQCIPSVDVRAGRCVRLFQGDYARETLFYDDAVVAVRRWVDEGAPLTHVVDLDGARGEPLINGATLDSLVAANPGRLQIAGGIRTLERAAELIERGAARVVFGSAAVSNPDLCVTACRRWPEQTVLGLDARRGLLAVEGWTRQTQVRAVDLARRLADAGLRWLIYTDIDRDGTLTSPNYEALREVVHASPANVIAAGGVSSADQIGELVATGAVGAILGRALYDGRLTYADAAQAATQAGEPAGSATRWNPAC